MQSFVSQWHKCMSKDDFIFILFYFSYPDLEQNIWMSCCVRIPTKSIVPWVSFSFVHSQFSHLISLFLPFTEIYCYWFGMKAKLCAVEKLWKIIFHLKWYSEAPDFYCFFHCLIHLKLLVKYEWYEKKYKKKKKKKKKEPNVEQ